MKTIQSLYIGHRFYWGLMILILLFCTGFFVDLFYLLAKITMVFFVFSILLDLTLLYVSNGEILIKRDLPARLSNGDPNEINIYVKNKYRFNVSLGIIDELPPQFQVRDFEMKTLLAPGEEKKLSYMLKPLERGVYEFGQVLVYVKGYIGFFKRRFVAEKNNESVKVYPSFINMRKYEIMAISDRLNEVGIKRIRKIGHHTEFEQIREYVRGDDYRTINWKATARRSRLMINQYQEEKLQQVYNVIDMGRTMEMDFENMTLLDYAINSALVLANTALIKNDKTGLFTFNKDINMFMTAERKNNTMARILEILYKQDTLFQESDYAKLYVTIKRKINQRSLLIIYTNFESVFSLKRQMEYFMQLSKFHLVLVVIFENTEIKKLLDEKASSLPGIYIQTIAEKFIHNKKLIAREFGKHGIHCLITKPNQLTVNLINKYLEFKGMGLI
ncbi:MAG: DUF58 domain-containing protein [Bacteroidota bacterium]